MSDFKFEGLTIERLVAHTVFPRGKDKELVQPQTSDELMPMDSDSRDLIQIRITDALGSTSHGIEVQVSKSSEGSFMQKAAAMIHMDETQFIKQSQILAMDLAEAQTSPRWPGGVLIVLSGKVGSQPKPYLAVIKAETDRGFNVVEEKGVVSLKLIKKMLLSQTQKLYKIGMLVEINYQHPLENLYDQGNYRYFLFDHLLTSTETRSAAAYFYDSFLGMNITGSSKYQTRMFYEETKQYINSMPVEAEDKYELLEALRSELRSNNSTISLPEFSKKYMPKEYEQSYINALTEKGVPAQAMVKDIDYISSKFRRPRRVVFSSGVKIQVPPDRDFKEHVEVSSQEGGFTTVKIKGVVQEQE
jgi:hypothetical protein